MDPYRYVWHLLVSALVLPHDSAQYFSTDLLSCFTKALCCGGHRSKYFVFHQFSKKYFEQKMMSNQQHKRRRIDSESTATTAAPDTTDTNDVTATNAAGGGGGGGASSSSSSKGHKVVPERVSWVVHPEEPDELEAGTPSDTLAALLLLLSELPA